MCCCTFLLSSLLGRRNSRNGCVQQSVECLMWMLQNVEVSMKCGCGEQWKGWQGVEKVYSTYTTTGTGSLCNGQTCTIARPHPCDQLRSPRAVRSNGDCCTTQQVRTCRDCRQPQGGAQWSLICTVKGLPRFMTGYMPRNPPFPLR